MKCARNHCHRPATAGRPDGMCWRCRSNARVSAARAAARADMRVDRPRLGRPDGRRKACVRCETPTLVRRLLRDVCAVCRNHASREHQNRVREAATRADGLPLCSVDRCPSPRETGQTCWRHAVRFDLPPKPLRPRAEWFAARTRDPREGV